MALRREKSFRYTLIGIIGGSLFLGIGTFLVMAHQGQKVLYSGKMTMVRIIAEGWIDKLDRNLFERFGDVKAFSRSASAQRGNPNQVKKFMNIMMEAYAPIYDLMIVTDLKGKVIAVNDLGPDSKPLDTSFMYEKDFSREEWFQTIAKGGLKADNVFIQDLRQDEDVARIYGGNGESMMFSAPIFSQVNGEIIGVWISKMNWQRVVEAISKQEIEKIRDERISPIFASLVDKKGRLLFSIGNDYDAVDPSELTPYSLVRERDIQTPGFSGPILEAIVPSLGYSSYRGVGWHAVLKVPAKDPLQKFNQKLIWIASVLFILAAFVALTIVTRIQRALNKLQIASSEIAHGNYNLKVETVGAGAEIQVFTEAFNKMTSELAIAMGKERAAAEQMRLQNHALETSANAVYICDREGIIIWANRAFYDLTGYSKSEIVGRTARVIKSGKHDKNFYRKLWDTITSGNSFRGEMVNRKKDGTYYDFEVIISPMKAEDGTITHFIAIAQDITARKADERTILEQQNQLINSSKMVALGEMAGNIAHEINSPLAAISLNAESLLTLAKANKMTPDRAKKLVMSIVSTVSRISRIINGLRTFAREGGDDPFQSEKVSTVISDTLALCQQRYKNSGIEIQVEAIDEAIIIECRPWQISQVILNLLNNSFDAIQSATQPNSEKWVKIGCKSDGEFVEISIIDSGQGISEEIRNKIMEPFFTTKPRGKGTGLGLSISRGIIEAHNGMLFLNEAASNTTFVIRLPVSKKERRLG